MRIILLEDDKVLSDTICDLITDSGHVCDPVYTGNSTLDKLYKETYDLYLFDVNVPGIKGFQVLKELRDSGDMTPAIFITSLSNESEVINGYNSGCDDYIRKPFSLSELLLKIEMIFKRVYGLSENKIKLSDKFVFDITTYEIENDENIIQLRKKEGQILSLFIKNRGVIITKDDIISDIWDDVIPSDAVIRVYLSSLKRILGDDLLITVRGLGYKLEKL